MKSKTLFIYDVLCLELMDLQISTSLRLSYSRGEPDRGEVDTPSLLEVWSVDKDSLVKSSAVLRIAQSQ